MILTGGLNISFIDREMKPNSFWKKIFSEHFSFYLDYSDLDLGTDKKFYNENRFVFGKEYIKHCNGYSDEKDDEKADIIIEKLYPEISYMKYKRIMKEISVSDTYEVHDYYSESELRRFTLFSVRELIDLLVMECPERFEKYVYKD